MTMEMLEERGPNRPAIVRNAIVYTPLAAGIGALFLWSVFSLLTGNPGAIIMAFILGLIGFALVFESIAALRDLRSEPTKTEGEARRIWKKSKVLIFGRQDYVLVDGQVFEIGPVAATELSEGQRVSIRHWPHTMRVITLERSRDGGGEAPTERRRRARPR
jgi:hypothetical protein